MFDTLSLPESVVDRCAEAIRRAILTGALPVGSRLPPERSLATQFDVHRGTVRGALARLTDEGLLDVRQGRGYRVKDYQRSAGPDLLGSLAKLAAEEGTLDVLVGDLLLVRRQLAATVLGRLSERQEWLAGAEGEAARRAIHEAVADFADRVDDGSDVDELAEADLAIVASLVAATGSSVLALCMNPILDVLVALPGLRRAIYREPADNLVGWQLLLAWLDEPGAAPLSLIVAELERRDAATLAGLGGKA